jgi:(S)-sulfolactate dehydrogenase
MPQIVVSEFMDPKAVEAAAADYDVFYDPDLVDDPPRMASLLAEARALVVRNRTQVDRRLLDAAPRLEVVGRLGVGLDNIDLAACKERGVRVCPATGANDAAVAEWVITCAMVLMRGAYLQRPAMLAGEWPRGGCMGHEIGGKVIGLVGFGAIARETGTRARALGMSVAAVDPYVPADHPAWRDAARHETLDALLAAVDIVSLHTPLTPETRHLIDARALGLMRPGALLLNAARGGVVDETALAEALRSGRLGGAALDVFESEPLTAAAAARFADLPNLLLTPHIGGVTIESNQRVSQVTMANVRAVLEGKS